MLRISIATAALLLMAGAAPAQQPSAPAHTHQGAGAPAAAHSQDLSAGAPRVGSMLTEVGTGPDALIGREVVDQDGETLGRIADIVLEAAGGRPMAAVIDLPGGGAKSIAVSLSLLETDGDRVRARELDRGTAEAMPDFAYEQGVLSLTRGAAQ